MRSTAPETDRELAGKGRFWKDAVFAEDMLAVSLGSWDSYDLWASHLGVAARRAYYAGSFLGRMASAGIQAVDLLAPMSSRVLFCRRKQYASVLSQRALAGVLAYEESHDSRWLEGARTHWEQLQEISLSPGDGMSAWGLPFDWQSSRMFYPAGTPFVTQSAYAVEAGVALYLATREGRYADDCARIGRFLLGGCHTRPGLSGGIRASYGPGDESFVYNSNAYRCYCLRLLGHIEILDPQGEDLNALEYVLSGQREDGSWPYGDGPEYNYVDHYHTVFVLKSLAKMLLLGREVEAVSTAIEKGNRFYFQHLFHTRTGLPLPYACRNRWNPVRMDGYDLAEALGYVGLLRLMTSEGHLNGSLRVVELDARAAILRAFPFVRGHRSFWRRYGAVDFYRDFDRWARVPYILALAYSGLSGIPRFLSAAGKN